MVYYYAHIFFKFSSIFVDRIDRYINLIRATELWRIEAIV